MALGNFGKKKRKHSHVGLDAWGTCPEWANQPPATTLTISRRSADWSWRWENSEGVTASPLCSTTTLRGRRFWASRNCSREQGRVVSILRPLAITKGVFTAQAVKAASQSFQTGSYPRRRIRSATSLGERSSAMSNWPVACGSGPAAAHSLAPSSTMRPRSVW